MRLKMGDKPFNFDEVEEDSKSSTSSSGSSSDGIIQIFVSSNYGTVEFNSDHHDCVQCDDDMEAVIRVDRMGRQESGLDVKCLPVCEEHVEFVNEAIRKQHYESETIRE